MTVIQMPTIDLNAACPRLQGKGDALTTNTAGVRAAGGLAHVVYY